METKEEKPKTEVKKFEPQIADMVLKRIDDLKSIGGLNIPPEYSPANALRSAMLILNDMKDKSNLPVLQTCSKESVMNALFGMTVQGLNPMKRQCAFIVRAGKLTMQRQYSGSIALARRFGNVADVKAGIIYENDIFQYNIETQTGRKKIVRHDQVLENIKEDKIKGCYAVVTYNDGSTDMLPMTMDQVRASWAQGELGGKGPAHLRFTSAMAEKTVINKICKVIIDSSDDSALFVAGNDEQETRFDTSELQSKGSVIDIPEEPQEAEVVTDTPAEPQQEAQPDTKVKTDKRTREWKQGDAPTGKGPEPGF